MPETPARDLWRKGPVWTASDRPIARYVARPLREFLRVESAGSILLLVATVLALLWVNLPFDGWAEGYDPVRGSIDYPQPPSYYSQSLYKDLASHVARAQASGLPGG